MRNEASGDSITKFSGTSSVGRDIIDLCYHLLKLTRPVIIPGGASDIGSYDKPARETIVQNTVAMARAIGIPTITGERYLRLFTLGPDNIHAEKTDARAHIFLGMFQDMRNCSYAIALEGSLRNVDARRALAA